MSDGTPQNYSRRGLLKAGTGAAATLAATGASGTALAQDTPYDGYLSDANLFDGRTADLTGEDSVTVEVGAGENGLAFSPAAINVDPGTTVTWEWTGQGSHNVVAEDDTFDSGSTVSEEGHTFEFTFESEGVHKYFCSPHKTVGMKGVVAVGDTADGDVVPPSELGGGGGTPTPSGNGDGGEFPAVSDYLADANGFDGVEDMTDQQEVTVEVGAGQGLSFGPAAVHVAPGTTVTWEWTGQGGAHNVVAEDEDFDSGDTQTSGTFTQTFDEDATHLYYCDPHQTAGMKGAVVVGEGGDTGGGGNDQPETAANQLALQTLLAMIALGLLSPIVFLLIVRRKMSGPPRPE